ncbi:MAG: bifunctional DNA-formamidopyrimidine glycosylase/DNA-(apurinic or apyrimidinic site) lyase [Deltaproteobacteria bacterium]|nr:bifunctional DNA-formamidopyrimidine glycosylase/DNA-(apurinic or apyrimidinic site) lyase [Deltaproteobacteria bacterium]
MPELPEVETVRRSLARHVVGKAIAAVVVRDRRLREIVAPRRLKRIAIGRRIVAVRRRAKYLLVDLEAGASLLLHLGMSGRLRLAPKGERRRTHDHVIFGLDDGRELLFNDPRRFGRVVALEAGDEPTHPLLRALGVEPLGGDLDPRRLWAVSQRRRRPLKTFLLDSHFIVGIGNIYACEALARARLSPFRPVGSLSLGEWRTLARAIRATLTRAVADGGTTLKDFFDPDGNTGYFATRLAVYGRAGAACGRCGGPIRRLVQAGRATFFCPHCQRR